jgi:hypothetical protein
MDGCLKKKKVVSHVKSEGTGVSKYRYPVQRLYWPMLCRRSSNSNLPITSSDVILLVREPGLGCDSRLRMCARAASSREFWFALALPLMLPLPSSVISLMRSTRGPGEPKLRASPSRGPGPGLDRDRSRRRGLPNISSDATKVAFIRRN